jgi:hypothetical protein
MRPESRESERSSSALPEGKPAKNFGKAGEKPRKSRKKN